jgi:peptidoglycan/LPS O-acetylase OafA/YrhL
VLWAGFILVLLLAPLRTKAVFSNPVLAWLGILSYSIYMVHVPFMQRAVFGIRGAWPHVFARAAWNLPVFLLTGALSIACVGLSALTYQFIERPFLVRKARIDS